ncbi:transmembrane 4 L6 family member 4-like [Lithobates pipiens]
MCTGKCSMFIGISLYPMAAIAIVCNIILFFPGWKPEPIQNPGVQMTPEVLYLGGFIGGGLLVLIPAIHIQATGRQGCCNNRCGMFLSIIFAAIGVAGALYGFVVSIVSMVKGPVCQYRALQNFTQLKWGRPFDSELKDFSDDNYLFNTNIWSTCVYPEGVVAFNVALFSLVLFASGISLILCTIQVLNGLFGCLCGTCGDKSDLD